MDEKDFVALVATVATHIAREDERDEVRDKLFARMNETLVQLKHDSDLLMAEYKAIQEEKRRIAEAQQLAMATRGARWEKIRTSVIGWMIVGTLGWFVTTGVAVVKSSHIMEYIKDWSAR